jgi:hypothetical protein
MRIRVILGAINRYAGIYVCLALFFGFCWFLHFAATIKAECCKGGLCLINDQTLRAVALIDWVSSHSWLAIAYFLPFIACVAFLQIRGRPRWTWSLTAVLFCIPCVVYWLPCLYIFGKLILIWPQQSVPTQ